MSLSWGVAGTGRIAGDVGGLIADHPQMRVAAVGSRDPVRAAAMAQQLRADRAHGSYADLVEDPAVQAVYVATPHAGHAAVVEAALDAGRAVLCEKPLTASLAETERLAARAQSAGVFLMEGMWMRFNPLVQQLAGLIDAGELGEIRSLAASFGFAAPYDATGRLWDPGLGGGALLDLGVYCVDLARLLLGTPEQVEATGSLAPTGVDAESTLVLSWASGATALLAQSLVSNLSGIATVVGSRGWASLLPSFHAPTQLVVQTDGPVREHTIDDRRAGFVGELEEVARCLAEGRTSSEVMPLAETLATMRVLHEARAQLRG